MPERKKPRLITTGAVLTMAGVLVLGGLYLARVSSKLSSLKQRNFRIAATLAEMTEKKINNVGEILQSEAGDMTRQIEYAEIGDDQLACLAALAEAVGLASLARLRLSELSQRPGFPLEKLFDHGSLPGLDEQPLKELQLGELDEQQRKALRDWGNADERGDERAKQARLLLGLAEMSEIAANNRIKALPAFHHVHWHLQKNDAQEKDRPTIDVTASTIEFQQNQNKVTLHAKARLERFFSYLSDAKEDAFDDVLIIDNSSRVIFQRGDSSFRIGHRFPVPSRQEEKAENGTRPPPETGFWPISLRNLERVELAGQRHALFRQPLQPAFDQERSGVAQEDDTGDPMQWYVVGVVRSDRLLSEALRFPPSTLAYVVATVVLILCVLPLFEVWASSPRERLRRRQVWTTSIGLSLGTAMLTLITVDIALNWVYQDSLREKLRVNADGVEEALETQVEEAVAQLEYLQKCYSEEKETGDLPIHNSAGNLFKSDLTWKTKNDSGAEQDLRYPHLDMVYWTDREGEQIAKWTVGETPTPLINVKERKYFQRAVGGDLWSTEKWDCGKCQPFFAEAIRSWTTGSQEVVISQRTKPKGDVSSSDVAPVAAMVITKLPCMLRPSLPPGCGFAVIDADVDVARDGEVIFHSQPERNRAENFAEECENASELQGALFSGVERYFTSRYWGQEYVMFARPLARLPWHIVVFQEKTLLQTVRFEAIELALVFLLLEAILLVLTLWVIRWLDGPRVFRFLASRPDVSVVDARTVAIAVLMILGLLTSIFFLHSPGLLVAGGILFPLATLTWVWSAATAASGRRVRHRWLTFWIGAGFSLVFLAYEGFAAVTTNGMVWRVWAIHAGLFVAAGAIVWNPLWIAGSSFLPQFFQRRSATTRFTVTGLALLAAISAVPAATFLWAASQDRLNLEYLRGQLHLAEDLAHRDRQIASEYEALERPLRDLAVNDIRDVHYGGYFDVCFDAEKKSSSDDVAGPPPSLFGIWPLTDFYYLNRHSIEARAVAGKGHKFGGWKWSTESGRPLLEGSLPGGDLGVEVRSPPLAPTASSLLGASIIGLAFTGVVGGGLRFMGRQMFLVDLRSALIPVQRLKNMHIKRLLLIVPPRTDTSRLYQDAKLKVDFSQAGRAAGDTELEKLGRGLRDAEFVRIDHLEGLLMDASARAEALPLLETALAKPESEFQIVVFSHRDPMALLDVEQSRLAEEPTGLEQRRDLQRWQELLNRFAEHKTLLNPKQFHRRLNHEIDDYRRDVWWALGRDERHLLAQIAEGSLVNRDLRPSLHRLLGWELVERVQLAFRVKDEKFREFILHHYDRKTLRAWEQEAAIGLWRQLRGPFYVSLGLVVLFLLVTQPQLFDVTFGLIATGAGSLAAVIKIFDSLRKSRPSM